MLQPKIEREAMINKIARAIATGDSVLIDQLSFDSTISAEDYEIAIRRAIEFDKEMVPRILSGKYIICFIDNVLSGQIEYCEENKQYEALIKNNYELLIELMMKNLVSIYSLLYAAIRKKDYNLWGLVRYDINKDFWLTSSTIFEKLAEEIIYQINNTSFESVHICDKEVKHNLIALSFMLKDMVAEGFEAQIELIKKDASKKKLTILIHWLENEKDATKIYKEISTTIQFLD